MPAPLRRRGRHCPGPLGGDEILVAHRVVGDGKFEHPIEHHPPAARAAAVEAEHELIQVAGQVRLVRRALVGAQQPPLGQRDNLVHGGQQLSGILPAGPGRPLAVPVVDVAEFLQPATPQLTVSPVKWIPQFVANVLPVGIRGLILAALLAATMSSVDSALNSFATVGVMDLYRRHVPKRAGEEAHLLRMGRLITLITGALATLAAVGVSSMQSTVIQTVHSLASTFVGPITGMFFLGVLTRRVQVRSMLVGAFLGLATSVTVAWTPIGQDINWMWTAPFGSIVTFVTGYTLSLVRPKPTSFKLKSFPGKKEHPALGGKTTA